MNDSLLTLRSDIGRYLPEIEVNTGRTYRCLGQTEPADGNNIRDITQSILTAVEGLSFAPKAGTIVIVGQVDGVPSEITGEYDTVE